MVKVGGKPLLGTGWQRKAKWELLEIIIIRIIRMRKVLRRLMFNIMIVVIALYVHEITIMLNVISEFQKNQASCGFPNLL